MLADGNHEERGMQPFTNTGRSPEAINTLGKLDYPVCDISNKIMTNIEYFVFGRLDVIPWGCGRKPGLRIRQEVVDAFL